MDAFAEVCFIQSEFGPVFRGTFHIGLYIYQGTDETAKFFIEVGQEFILLFVERTEIVFIILKERSMVIGRLYGIPMQVPPVTVVGNTYIPHGAFQGIRFDGGDGKSQFTVRCGNGTAVAVGLLHIVVVLFDKHFVVCQQFGVILYGG